MQATVLLPAYYEERVIGRVVEGVPADWPVRVLAAEQIAMLPMQHVDER